jgi:hypothetical protein
MHKWTSPASGQLSGIAQRNAATQGNVSIDALQNVKEPSYEYVGQLLDCLPAHKTCQILPKYAFETTAGIAVVHSPDEKQPFEFVAADVEAGVIDTFTAAALSGQLSLVAQPVDIALGAKENRLFVSEQQTEYVAEYTFSVAAIPSGAYH